MNPLPLAARAAPAFALSSLALLSLGCAGTPAASDADQLHAIIDRVWEFRKREDPLFATFTGDHRWNDRLPSLALADLERRAEVRREFLVEIEALDRAALGETDLVNADMLAREIRFAVRDFELGGHEMPFNADSGFHTGFARLARDVPLESVTDYDNYLARLAAAPEYFAQQIAHLQAGVDRGFVLPSKSLEGYEGTMASHVAVDPGDSVFWEPFEAFPDRVPESDQERLLERAENVLPEVAAAYGSLLSFFVGTYLPAARATFGASELPSGREFYEEQVRWFTTLDLPAEEIHQLGLEEVARIRAEMEAVIEEASFDGGFNEFVESLRTDPRFYVDSPEQLLKEAALIAKRMDGRLPALFGRLPRLPYTVEPVPASLAPKYTSARYVQAPQDSGEPGVYWVNTYNLASRPLFSLEALTFHEAVPGHHLQLALAAELEGIPEFRRLGGITAFVEGWALYAEWLGIEAGFYLNPYTKFGRLSNEMWRACRLVVDTGVHAMGWSRDEMIDFMASNTALSLHEIETETDRYITWPGQALGYKIGELEIRSLRRQAEEHLGDRFDVREFHDVVLGNGALPLSVLRRVVERWLNEVAGS